MEITEIKIFPTQEEKLKAYVSIILDHCFVIRDIKIIKRLDKLFVAMPSKRKKDGNFRDIAHPLNQETRALMEKQILDAYLNRLKSENSSTTEDKVPKENE